MLSQVAEQEFSDFTVWFDFYKTLCSLVKPTIEATKGSQEHFMSQFLN